MSSEDLKSAVGLQNKTLLCIKAPEGTKIQVLPTQQNENLDLTLSSPIKPIKIFVVDSSKKKQTPLKANSKNSKNITHSNTDPDHKNLGQNLGAGGSGVVSILKNSDKDNIPASSSSYTTPPAGCSKSQTTASDNNNKVHPNNSSLSSSNNNTNKNHTVHNQNLQNSELYNLNRRYTNIFQSPEKQITNEVIQSIENDNATSTGAHDSSINRCEYIYFKNIDISNI